MKKTYFMSLAAFACVLISCQKEQAPSAIETNAHSSPELLATSLNNTNAVTFATEITMDNTNDNISYPTNTIVNGLSGLTNATLEGGSGFVMGSGSSLVTRQLIKTPYGRGGTFGLNYDLPNRDAAITYDQNNSDRFESCILQNADFATYENAAHYSGFSFYIPTGKDLVTDWFVIHQWHQSSPESPVIAFELAPGYYSRLRVSVRYGKGNAQHNVYNNYLTRQDDASGHSYIDLPRNKWIDFVVRWKLDHTGTTGELKVYKHEIDASSSTLVFQYNGQIGYSMTNATVLNEKFGIYRKADYAASHKIVYDQIRVGSTFNSVKPW